MYLTLRRRWLFQVHVHLMISLPTFFDARTEVVEWGLNFSALGIWTPAAFPTCAKHA